MLKSLVAFILSLSLVTYANPPRDAYEILRIQPSATAKQIKDAHRKLVRTHHPDRNPGDEDSGSRFREIQEAYDILSDPLKRNIYDSEGYEGIKRGYQRDRAEDTSEGQSQRFFYNQRVTFKIHFNKRGGPVMDTNLHLLAPFLYTAQFLPQLSEWQKHSKTHWASLSAIVASFDYSVRESGIAGGFEDLTSYLVITSQASTPFKDASALALKAFFPAYVQSSCDLQSKSFLNTLARMRHLGVSDAEIKRVISERPQRTLLEDLANEWDPIAFHKKVLHHLRALKGKVPRDFLSEIAPIYVEHFGGNTTTFLGLLLHHHATLTQDGRLTHKTLTDRRIIRWVLGAVQSELLGRSSVGVPNRVGFSGEENQIGYALFLYQATFLPVSGVCLGMYEPKSIPFWLLRRWLMSRPECMDTLTARTGIPKEHWEWFTGSLPAPYSPLFSRKTAEPLRETRGVIGRADERRKQIWPKFTNLLDFAEALSALPFSEIVPFLTENFETFLEWQQAAIKLKGEARSVHFSAVNEILLASFLFSEEALRVTLTQRLASKGYPNIYWLQWVQEFAFELAETSPELETLLETFYNTSNVRGLTVWNTSSRTEDLEASHELRQKWLSRIILKGASEIDRSPVRFIESLLRRIEKVDAAQTWIQYERMVGDIFYWMEHRLHERSLKRTWNRWIHRLPQVDEIGTYLRIRCATKLASPRN